MAEFTVINPDGTKETISAEEFSQRIGRNITLPSGRTVTPYTRKEGYAGGGGVTVREAPRPTPQPREAPTPLTWYERLGWEKPVKVSEATPEQLEAMTTVGGAIGKGATERYEQLWKKGLVKRTYRVISAPGGGGKFPEFSNYTIDVTPQYFEELQKKELIKIAEEKGLGGTPGERTINVGTLTQEVSPGRVAQTYEIGGKTYTYEREAPEGTRFNVDKPRETVTPLEVRVNVTEEMAEAEREKTREWAVKKDLAKMSGAEVVGQEIRTLMTPLGFEWLGAVLRNKPKESFDVVRRRMAYDLKKAEEGEPLIRPTIPKGWDILNPVPVAIGGTLGRSVSEFQQSPVFEVEVSMLGGAVLGTATKAPSLAKLIGSKAGRSVLYGAGAVGGGARAVDVGISYATGNINRAVGLAVTTGLDIAGAVAMYKISKPEPKIYTKKLQSAERKMEEVDFRDVKVDYGKAGDIKISGQDVKYMEQKVGYRINTKDIPALQKRGWTFDIARGEQVRIDTQPLRPPTVHTESVLQATAKPGVSQASISQTISIEQPKQFYIYRGMETGQIKAVGYEKSFLRDIGLKSKFPQKEYVVDLTGIRETAGVRTTKVTGEYATGYREITSYEFLQPSKVTTNIVETPSVWGEIFASQKKGTATLRLPSITQTQPTLAIETIPAPSTGISTGVTVGFEAVGKFDVLLGIMPGLTIPGLMPVQRGKTIGVTREAEASAVPVVTAMPKLQPALSMPKTGTGVTPEISVDFATDTTTETVTTPKTDTRPKTEPMPEPVLNVPEVGIGIEEETPRMPPPVIGISLPSLDIPKGKPGKSKAYGVKIIKNPVPELKDIFKGAKV